MAGSDRTDKTNGTGRIVGRTESVCPECLCVIPAEKVQREQGIFLVKTCPQHGTYETLIWEGSIESYEAWGADVQPADQVPAAGPVEKGCPYDCGLCGEHERRGCCVLLEVTGRCNLRCPVCFAGAGESGSRDVSMEELGRQMDYLMSHGGPFNLQISGGEPTVRDDLPELIRMGREKGFTFFQLNTNGLRLAEEPGYAEALKEAGLSCVFLQFDGVDDSVYEVLRGRALWKKKQEAVDACERAGLGVILVPVVTPGVNEDQMGKILSYAVNRMPVVRGVHFQPISYFGRCLEAQGSYRLTIPKILSLIEQQTDGRMRAAHFTGGNATNPYCTFQANYLKQDDGNLQPMIHGTARAYATSEQAREFVARQWTGPEEGGGCCCGAEGEEPSAPCCSAEVKEPAVTCCCGTEGEESSAPCCCSAEAEEPAVTCCCDAEAEEQAEPCCSTEQEGSSGGCCCGEDTAQMQLDTSSLDDFLRKLHNNTFAVSGMLFQDAGSLDLERLRRCYILETDSRYGMVPFCAYNMTGQKGKTLYR